VGACEQFGLERAGEAHRVRCRPRRKRRGLRHAGARWRRQGTDAWLESGQTDPAVAAGNQTIEFKPTPLFKGNLTHWHLDTFELTWQTQMMLPPGRVTFLLDKEGKVTEMQIYVNNPDFDFGELKLYKKK
jgi:hypothetical protein